MTLRPQPAMIYVSTRVFITHQLGKDNYLDLALGMHLVQRGYNFGYAVSSFSEGQPTVGS